MSAPLVPARIAADGPHARAYTGPAHGHQWQLDDSTTPPLTVELGIGPNRCRYRLVHDPRNQRPARDHLGNYLYVPVHRPTVA